MSKIDTISISHGESESPGFTPSLLLLDMYRFAWFDNEETDTDEALLVLNNTFFKISTRAYPEEAYDLEFVREISLRASTISYAKMQIF